MRPKLDSTLQMETRMSAGVPYWVAMGSSQGAASARCVRPSWMRVSLTALSM